MPPSLLTMVFFLSRVVGVVTYLSRRWTGVIGPFGTSTPSYHSFLQSERKDLGFGKERRKRDKCFRQKLMISCRKSNNCIERSCALGTILICLKYKSSKYFQFLITFSLNSHFHTLRLLSSLSTFRFVYCKEDVKRELRVRNLVVIHVLF